MFSGEINLLESKQDKNEKAAEKPPIAAEEASGPGRINLGKELTGPKVQGHSAPHSCSCKEGLWPSTEHLWSLHQHLQLLSEAQPYS